MAADSLKGVAEGQGGKAQVVEYAGFCSAVADLLDNVQRLLLEFDGLAGVGEPKVSVGQVREGDTSPLRSPVSLANSSCSRW